MNSTVLPPLIEHQVVKASMNLSGTVNEQMLPKVINPTLEFINRGSNTAKLEQKFPEIPPVESYLASQGKIGDKLNYFS